MSGKLTSPMCCCTTDGGFKHVVSAVRWLGGEHPYGYMECSDVDTNWWLSDPCPGSVCSSYIPYSPNPPDHKYLGNTLYISWSHHEHRTLYCGPYLRIDTDYRFVFLRSRSAHTDRFTGLNTISETITWDDYLVDSVTPGNSAESHLTGADALAKFNSMHPPYTGLDAKCGHIQPTAPLAGSDANWNKLFDEVTDTSCEVGLDLSQDVRTSGACTGDLGESLMDDDHLTKEASFIISTTLFDKFTSAELYDYCKSLLALWNLGDDTHYPWRTTCASEAYHLGAAVTFDYGGDLFGVPGAIVGGPFSGETWSVGPHALTGYSAEGMSGGSVWYNNEASVWGYTGDYLIVGKWAEKKVTLPSHNYARPCGPVDAAAVDIDLNLCWPGIADPCVDPCNNTTSTGDYTTYERTWPKRANAEATRMNGMAEICPGGSPCSDAHAYTVLPTWDNTCAQENAASGTILFCSPNTENFGAATVEQTGTFPTDAGPIGDDKYGYLWQCHIRQMMPDPLIDCEGLYGSPDAVLLEESRCSVPGGCPALPAGAVFYCTDANDSGCGFQDSYGLQCPPL